jgi:hypothetical protein
MTSTRPASAYVREEFARADEAAAQWVLRLREVCAAIGRPRLAGWSFGPIFFM